MYTLNISLKETPDIASLLDSIIKINENLEV